MTKLKVFWLDIVEGSACHKITIWELAIMTFPSKAMLKISGSTLTLLTLSVAKHTDHISRSAHLEIRRITDCLPSQSRRTKPLLSWCVLLFSVGWTVTTLCSLTSIDQMYRLQKVQNYAAKVVFSQEQTWLNASRPTERVLRSFWQAVLWCCGAPSPSPSLLADSSSHCRTSPHRTHLCLWSSAVTSSPHPHPPSHQTGLWSSAVASSSLEDLIHNSESAYRDEAERLAGWCSENDLELNVSKTKEMVFDFRKKKTPLVPLTIAGEVVEEVRSFKFLGTTISSDLKWDENFSSAIKKAHQRLFFLRQLKKFKVNHSILTQFYRAATESILTFSITVWYSSACQKDKDQLERIVRTASKIIGSDMKPIASLHSLRSDRKVMAIAQDTSHPANHLFQSLPSGRRYRALRDRTSRFQNSFYPQAVRSFIKWSVC